MRQTLQMTWDGKVLTALRTSLSLTPFALILLGLEAFFALPLWLQELLWHGYYGMVGLFTLHLILKLYHAPSKSTFFRSRILDILLLLPLTLAIDGLRLTVGLIALRQSLVLIRSAAPMENSGQTLSVLRLSPARVMALSFAGTILVGTVLLMLPIATQDQQGAGLVDALFTATSAVCVTGLTVLDTPTYFSAVGQVFIMGLMQVGGLGIMTFSTFLAITLRRRLGVQDRMVMQGLLDESNIETLKLMIVGILKMTFMIESIGALMLTWAWYTEMHDLRRALYLGVFHSIAAFNNAGFALFTDNLMPYRGHVLINLVITTLIILGGLGFTVIFSLPDLCISRRRRVPRVSCHTKLVLATTTILLAVGTCVFFLAEYSKTMAGFSWTERLLASYFLAVTPRTAGFNTVDTASLTDLSLFITIILMFIGASPASTGGGVKTSTFALLVLSIRSILRYREEVEIFYRTVPREIVHRALVIITLSFSLINLFTIMLLLTEDIPFLKAMFEVVSAFGTVGLSMGLTPQLTAAGKVIIVVVMFIGRVGPLTMGLALGEQREKARFAYPAERVMVG
jgi:trk system potassium uptake protein TrkH